MMKTLRIKPTVLKLALCLPLLLTACGTHKTIAGADETAKKEASAATQPLQQRKLAYVQKVYDNQVYAKNITGSMTFSVKAGDKDLSLPGTLRMRKNQIIRIQLNVPVLGSEVARIDITPDEVLVVDRMRKMYTRAKYGELDFLQRNGLSFYALQALFWNELLLPGKQQVEESDLKRFDAAIDQEGSRCPVTLGAGKLALAWTTDRPSGRILQTHVDYDSATRGKSELTIGYDNFKSVGSKNFPAKITFTLSTTDGKGTPKNAQMTFDLDEVGTDSKWDTTTTLSDKYKQVDADAVLGKIISLK